MSYQSLSGAALLFLALIAVIPSFAQEETDIDMMKDRSRSISFQISRLAFGNADFIYEQRFNDRYGVDVTLGVPYFRVYDRNYGAGYLNTKFTYGVNTGIGLNFYLATRRANSSITFGVNYRFVRLDDIRRTYEWTRIGDGSPHNPSSLYPFETSLCDECRATLNERRSIIEPHIIARWAIGKAFFTDIRFGFGLRVISYKYQFLEIRKYATPNEFDDYFIYHHLAYPIVILNIGLGKYL